MSKISVTNALFGAGVGLVATSFIIQTFIGDQRDLVCAFDRGGGDNLVKNSCEILLFLDLGLHFATTLAGALICSAREDSESYDEPDDSRYFLGL